MLKQRKNNGFVLGEAIFALFLATLTIGLIGYVMTRGLQQEQQASCWLDQAASNLMELHRSSLEVTPPNSLDNKQYQPEILQGNAPVKVPITCKNTQEVIEIETIQRQSVRFSLD